MIFVNPIFSTPIEFKENEIQILVIENKNFYQEIVSDLLLQSDGFDGENSIYSGTKELSIIKSVDVITDLFTLDVNKSVTKLYNAMKNYYLKEGYLKVVELNFAITEFMKNVDSDFEYQLEYGDSIDLVAIFKGLNVKFVFDGKTILEKLIDYIRIISQFHQKKLFIILNIKSVLSTDEIQEFYKYIFYNKIEVLLIETEISENIRADEKVKIIDEDLCEID